jgi:ectoine hydroxylase-related dioxygenase (phytanoyl-CoA dioxygenase family)
MNEPVRATGGVTSISVDLPATSMASVRALSDAEVAFYREHGWAKLERFIPPDMATAMLATVKARMQSPDSSEPGRAAPKLEDWGRRVVDSGYWRDYHYLARDDREEPFHSLAFCEQIGRNSQRLIARNVGIRFNTDFVAVKVPGPADSPANRPTTPHQDFVNVPFDRVGNHNYWIALDDVAPEQGALRFYSGSHRLGPLGLAGPDHDAVFESYRDILDHECQLSEPVSLKPGDATVHSSLTIHCASSNVTERWRVGYVLAYMPADSRYTGAPFHNLDGTGLAKGDRFDHPRFPVIFKLG